METKKCSKCKIEKPVSEFPTRFDRKTPYHCQCYVCRRKNTADWYQRNKKRVYFYNLYYRVGLTKKQWEKLVQDQKGLCAICGKTLTFKGKSCIVDHCHKTGNVRGILCGHCNASLGWYEGHKEVIEKYLSKIIRKKFVIINTI